MVTFNNLKQELLNILSARGELVAPEFSNSCIENSSIINFASLKLERIKLENNLSQLATYDRLKKLSANYKISLYSKNISVDNMISRSEGLLSKLIDNSLTISAVEVGDIVLNKQSLLQCDIKISIDTSLSYTEGSI